MEFAVLLALLLVLGAVVAVVARRRLDGTRDATSGLAAEADANRWVVRLGGSLAGIDVRAQTGADGDAARSLTEAAQSLRSARARLAAARTPDQYAVVVRTAAEGLHHVGEARRALGLDPAAQGTERGPLDRAARGGGADRGARADRVGRADWGGRKELLHGLDASYWS